MKRGGFEIVLINKKQKLLSHAPVFFFLSFFFKIHPLFHSKKFIKKGSLIYFGGLNEARLSVCNHEVLLTLWFCNYHKWNKHKTVKRSAFCFNLLWLTYFVFITFFYVGKCVSPSHISRISFQIGNSLVRFTWCIKSDLGPYVMSCSSDSSASYKHTA